MKSPFMAGTGMLGATEPGQRVTATNAKFLPPGSVVRLDDGDVMIHLHDDLWYWRGTNIWCYDRLENMTYKLPGELCHIPLT